MDEQVKHWIDSSDYETLLRKWRYAPVGDNYFEGEQGAYYKKVMFEKRDALPHDEQVKASKNVGWERLKDNY